MDLWWSILDAKPSSEYEILLASKTFSLLQEYCDEIVHWHSKIKPIRSVISIFTKMLHSNFPENKFQFERRVVHFTRKLILLLLFFAVHPRWPSRAL